MSLIACDAGLFATVQDQGRRGYRAFGVPPGGAFDRESADLANALLGNGPDAAVVELTLRGGRYQATVDLALALCGATMPATIETSNRPPRALEIPGCFTLKGGEFLAMGFATRGLRTYLAVKGGFQTKALLGSRSSETGIVAGQTLPCEPGVTRRRYLATHASTLENSGPIRVIDGPDAAILESRVGTQARRDRVLPRSDRVGLRLEGPVWRAAVDPNRLSTPTAPGAVQLAGGQLLILGAGCGTMGGYPHVAHVISADLGRIGQLRPGDSVAFHRVTLEEARHLDRERRDQRRCQRLRLAAWVD